MNEERQGLRKKKKKQQKKKTRAKVVAILLFWNECWEVRPNHTTGSVARKLPGILHGWVRG